MAYHRDVVEANPLFREGPTALRVSLLGEEPFSLEALEGADRVLVLTYSASEGLIRELAPKVGEMEVVFGHPVPVGKLDQLLALQALGYSLRRILLPFLGFGLSVSALSLAFSELVVPEAEALYRRELLTILYRSPTPLVQENVFFRGSQGELFYVERYTGARVEGVVVYDLSGRLFPKSSFPAVVTAKEGVLERGELLLREGRVLHFGSAGELAEILGFRELRVEVGEKLEEAVLGGRTPSEMSARELRERIELLRQSGHDVRGLWVEYHGKLAIAGAAFVFVLFGAPLGALLGRRGRAAGMVVGFLLAAGAQALFLWARTLSRRGFLPPFLGGWLPHLVLGSLGLLLWVGADRLRFRGSVLFLLWALSVVGLPAPPFTELAAEELLVEEDGRYWRVHQARLALGRYTLQAHQAEFREQGGWVLQAEGARVETADGWVEAQILRAQLSPEGEITQAELWHFQGEARFLGPEKPELLLFSAEQGVVELAQGEIARVRGTKVLFTTCPCLEGAPYLIQAEEFLVLPERWLFVRNLRVDSFGYPVVWLPFYAARLGEEGIPFLPEVGRAALGWFLRWSIPWSP
ncbi:MAG: LptF/LptG family permease, partial [Candidatus Bipolaricaulaceae bacterium]